MKDDRKQPRDPRAEIIPTIWGITVGIVAVSSVFSGTTDAGPAVSVLAIIGATVSSCVVWLTGHKPTQQNNPELEQAVVQLSQRVAQLEIDTRDMELRHAIQQSTRTTAQPTTQQPE